MNQSQARAARKKLQSTGADKGAAVRLSHFVIKHIKSLMRKNESYDSVMRRVFFLPNRAGQGGGNGENVRVRLYVTAVDWNDTSTMTVFQSKSRARGSVVLALTKTAREKRLSTEECEELISNAVKEFGEVRS